MSRAQLSAFIQASGSDQSMRSGRSRSSSRCQNKVPIIVIASPHPTVLTSNIEPDNPVEMSAEMMTSAASPMQASVMASIAGQMSGSTPVRQTSSGSLIMTANIKVTQSGTTLLQDAPTSMPTRRRQSSACSRGSQGRSTPSGLRPRRGSSDMLQVVGAGSIESMGCSGIFGVQMAGTDLFQELHEQGMQQHAMRAGRRGSRRGSRRSISRGSACASATSLSALAEGRATQRGAGQMNLVVNIPTPQDPTGKSLTVTIVQDAGSATIQPEPAPTMTMSSTAIMRQM
ncbi:uncharacterized protein LOC144094607 isoform X1 [Amblyomma americanum]